VSVSRDELERQLKDYGCSFRADMGALASRSREPLPVVVGMPPSLIRRGATIVGDDSVASRVRRR